MFELVDDRLRISLTSLTTAVVVFAFAAVLLGAYELGRARGQRTGVVTGYQQAQRDAGDASEDELTQLRSQTPATDVVSALVDRHARTNNGSGKSSQAARDPFRPSAESGAGPVTWTQGLTYRGKFDNTPEVVKFAETLERVCIETVEQGKMTKDLAILIGPDQPWLTTEGFFEEIVKNLEAAMAQAA